MRIIAGLVRIVSIFFIALTQCLGGPKIEIAVAVFSHSHSSIFPILPPFSSCLLVLAVQYNAIRNLQFLVSSHRYTQMAYVYTQVPHMMNTYYRIIRECFGCLVNFCQRRFVGNSFSALLVLYLTLTTMPSVSLAKAVRPKSDFKKAKTFFQINMPYRPSVDLPVDAVVIHPHSDAKEDLVKQLTTWRNTGIPVGRMFFADSDNANSYWTGKWDGKDHRQDTEIDKDGNIILCSGVRPYMLPTQGWTNFLKEKAAWSLDAGANAILPEEPLAHVRSGFEESFKKAWKDRYGIEWEPQNASAMAHYRTAYLKEQLYFELEQTLANQVHEASQTKEEPIRFVVPIHSLYSNIAAGLVAPLGKSCSMKHIDGYIGQIWTGPVRWSLAQYPSPEKSFFCSAFTLYDYFCQLTAETDKKLWLLVDPVEDDLNHTWPDFTRWYQHCTVAMLLMHDIDSYEVMPWPERIFLPEKTPDEFLTLTLSITQVLQDIPQGGKWLVGGKDAHIGVAIADSAMWQAQSHEVLKTFYSPIVPLLRRGIPVSSVVLERACDEKYMQRFKTIVLSFDGFKPYEEAMCDGLTKWVQQGGNLLVLQKNQNALESEQAFWWKQQGYASSTEALLHKLGNRNGVKKQWKFGKGNLVLAEGISPEDFSDPQKAEMQYLPLLKKVIGETEAQYALQETGCYCMKRGDFVIAHAETKPLKQKGKYVDLFSIDFAVCNAIDLKPGKSGLYKDVSDVFANQAEPKVLHTTYRLMSQSVSKQQLCFTVKGPKNTDLTALVYLGDRKVKAVSAVSDGQTLPEPHWEVRGETLLIRVANETAGVKVGVEFAE